MSPGGELSELHVCISEHGVYSHGTGNGVLGPAQHGRTDQNCSARRKPDPYSVTSFTQSIHNREACETKTGLVAGMRGGGGAPGQGVGMAKRYRVSDESVNSVPETNNTLYDN